MLCKLYDDYLYYYDFLDRKKMKDKFVKCYKFIMFIIYVIQ